jgi:hypothetical protein
MPAGLRRAGIQREVVMPMNSAEKMCGRAVKVFLITALLVASSALSTAQYIEEENIEVSCYKGNTEEGNYIGNLTVTTPENAGQDCNSFYYACQGQCLGCFPDSDFTEDVCYDNNGRRFLK